MGTCGYMDAAYAESLAEFGTPRLLPRSGGWLLERAIPSHGGLDAMGCYPLFTCADWSQLRADLEDLSGALVSVALVADPFGGYDLDELARCFPDRLARFKDHYVVDLQIASPSVISKHHRYYARRALADVQVDRCEPATILDDWVRLYATLTERHGLRGIKAFSPDSFAKQLQVPGVAALRATHAGQTVGAHLWYVNGDVAYSHLTAVSPLGYELQASYALYWTAVQQFGEEVRWLNLGAGAGSAAADDDGLARFKRGWSTGSRPAYFCGRVCDPQRYEELSSIAGNAATGYFPAYRAGEF